jgi:hypothetical protein
MHALSHSTSFDQISIFIKQYVTVKLLVMQHSSFLLSIPLKLQHTFLTSVCAQTTSVSVPPLRCVIKHLTPELKPSAQRCLTKFLLGILLLEQCISLIYALKNQQMQHLFIQFVNYVW